LRLSHRLGLALPRRRLHVCCEHAGIEVSDTHTALGDATATFRLLMNYLDRARQIGLSSLGELGCDNGSCMGQEWPPRAGSGRVARRGDVARSGDEGAFIRRLLERLETPPDVDEGVAAYFDVLDRVMEDRQVTDGEAETLYETARLWSLEPRDVRVAHRRYLRAVADAALGDGHISSAERDDLSRVAPCCHFSDLHQ
jgi:DNA polymerase-3 subunit epsilon